MSCGENEVTTPVPEPHPATLPIRDAAPFPEGPRILVCGWSGAGNVGDELLTRAVVERLTAAGGTAVVASRDPATTERLHPGVEAVRWGPRGLADLRDRGAIGGVIIGPGGILQDSSSVWSLPGHLILAAAAARRGAAVAAVGVGAETLRRRSSAVMLRRVLAGAPVVTRDDASSAALRQAGIEATTSADVVFGLVVPEPEPRDEILVSIGPATRPALVAPAARRLVAPPVAEIAAGLDALAATLSCRVVFGAFRGPRDVEAARAVGARLEAPWEVLAVNDIDEHVRRLVGARTVVASRYHPVVLAAVAGVPALVVADQAKIVSLVDQIGRSEVTRVPEWRDLEAVDPLVRPGSRRPPPRPVEAFAAIDLLVERAREPDRPGSRG